MSHVVEVDDRGSIQLPEDILAMIKPHSRFVVELQGERVILHPEDQQPAWMLTNPEERVKALHQWVNAERPTSQPLTDAMLNRDNLYD